MHTKHYDTTMEIDRQPRRVTVTIHHHGDYNGDVTIQIFKIEYDSNLRTDAYGARVGEIVVPCSALLAFAGDALSSAIVSTFEKVNFAAVFRGDWKNIFSTVLR